MDRILELVNYRRIGMGLDISDFILEAVLNPFRFDTSSIPPKRITFVNYSLPFIKNYIPFLKRN